MTPETEIRQLKKDMMFLEAVILDLFDGDSEKKEEYMNARMKEHFDTHTGRYKAL